MRASHHLHLSCRTRTLGGCQLVTSATLYRRKVMNAYDFNVAVPHSTGSLAKLAEEFGRENVNIEGLCAIEQNGNAIVHLLTTDKAATSRVIDKVGYKVI